MTDSAIALAVSDRRAVLEVIKEWINTGGGAQVNIFQCRDLQLSTYRVVRML